MIKYLLILNIFISHANAKECGDKFQVLIKLDILKKEGQVSKKKIHNKHFCEQDEPPNANTTITLLSDKKKMILEQRIFINKFTYYDFKNSKDAQSKVVPEKNLVFLHKFPFNKKTRKASFIKIEMDKMSPFKILRLK